MRAKVSNECSAGCFMIHVVGEILEWPGWQEVMQVMQHPGQELRNIVGSAHPAQGIRNVHKGHLDRATGRWPVSPSQTCSWIWLIGHHSDQCKQPPIAETTFLGRAKGLQGSNWKLQKHRSWAQSMTFARTQIVGWLVGAYEIYWSPWGRLMHQLRGCERDRCGGRARPVSLLARSWGKLEASNAKTDVAAAA